jgi:hypothetical protein
LVLLGIRQKRTSNQKAAQYKEDINSPRARGVDEELQPCVGQKEGAMPVYHADNSEGPEKVQPEETFFVNCYS